MQALAVLVGHAPCATVLDQDSGGQRCGAYGEVWACHRRAQVGVGGRASSAIAAGELVVPDPVLVAGVEVVVAWQAPRDGRVEPGPLQQVRLDRVLDTQRSALAVDRAVEPRVVLRTPEVGQHVAVTPAGGTEGV